jgi:alkaline phosphatase D
MSRTDGAFRHAVASGDPLQDRVMLWTRVTSDAGGPIDVTWTLARDPELNDVVHAGTAIADPERDHTVHVDVADLEPATTYYYGFTALGEHSPTARTRTLPGEGVDHLRIAMVSCASYNAGHFNAYGRIADRADLDFLLHLGDYIYETPNVLPPGAPQPPEMGRPFDPVHQCMTLDDYRRRYAQYHGDPNIQALHLMHPIIGTVDDHEFADGAWRDGSSWHKPEVDGPFADRKAAAFRARWEWLPYRPPDPSDMTRVYRTVPLGDLADLFIIDTRTRRDDPEGPPERDDPARTQLGVEQRDWLFGELERSTARWRLLGNASVMGQTWSERLPESVTNALKLLKLAGPGGVEPDPDHWGGYPVERASLLRHFEEPVGNLVVLSGDVHVGLAIELHEDASAGRDPVAVEFVTPSLTSMNIDDKMGWPRRDERSLAIERTAIETVPHWKWCELDSNGYVLIDVTPDRVLAEWWFVDTVLEPSTHEECGARWMVEHGRPWALPA